MERNGLALTPSPHLSPTDVHRRSQLQEEEAKKKEQAARQKIARKEYRKWLRLRSKDKYKSRVRCNCHCLCVRLV